VQGVGGACTLRVKSKDLKYRVMEKEDITIRVMVKYGIIYPVALIAACMVAELLESLIC
jgi:hypothetical protein